MIRIEVVVKVGGTMVLCILQHVSLNSVETFTGMKFVAFLILLNFGGYLRQRS